MKTLKRRRKEGKTNYLKRIKLLKSGKPRIVLRRTNRYFVVQYVMSDEARDNAVLGITSKFLLKYGWPENASGSLKSIPASYLTGFLIGKMIVRKKMEEPIADLGMARAISKTRVFAFLKGLIDSGVKIKCHEKCFPDDEKIAGGNMKNKIPFEEIKSKIENEK